METLQSLEIAVLLPCYNEELSIGDVVTAFQTALPDAKIYVYDNNSSDDTMNVAKKAGAIVRQEPMQGKGNVVRRMFADIEAEIFILADGDGTYAAADAPELLSALVDEQLDMVIGKRKDIHVTTGRAAHGVGNVAFNYLFRKMFRRGFSDIFSGYRVFSRRFVKSFPALSTGFEIETELSVHAMTLQLACKEIEVSYGLRVEGSVSKLSTVGDGLRILNAFFMLMKDVRPLAFFGALAIFSLTISGIFGVPVLAEYFQTGIVTLVPRWVLSVGLLLVALMMIVCGLILDSVAKGRVEQKKMAYLRIPASRLGATKPT